MKEDLMAGLIDDDELTDEDEWIDEEKWQRRAKRRTKQQQRRMEQWLDDQKVVERPEPGTAKDRCA